jgi:hypothetical protein
MFDPAHPTPNDSLNRIPVVDAPFIEPALLGQSSYQLLGRHFLNQEAARLAPSLSHEPDPFSALCLNGEKQAQAFLAREWGLRLAAVVFTLKNGSERSRAARPQWTNEHWRFWAQVENIQLAGGLVEGVFGEQMASFANDALDGLVRVAVAQWPRWQPLIGAALSDPQETGSRFVMDLGGTSIKRGLAYFDHSELVELEVFESKPSPNEPWTSETILGCLGTAYEGPSDQDLLVISCPAYVDAAGYPDRESAFGRLYDLGPEPTRTVSGFLRPAGSLTTRFVHDGTAAAKTMGGHAKTVVITMGTALAMGLPPATSTHIPSRNFKVRER